MQIRCVLGSGTNWPQRLLSIKWHPIFENVIASSSFDHIVRLYDLRDSESGPKKLLKFHTERVRSLSWNTELPWMLISAADNSSIAVWDTRSAVVIHSVHEPTLALTSFASHPDRPFSLVSSHFDSSIIVWSLLAIPEIVLAQYKLLLDVD